KQIGSRIVTKLPEPSGSDGNKEKIRNDVPKMRYADDCSLIGEVVIVCILDDRRQQQQPGQWYKHQNEESKYATTILRAAEHHLGTIAKATSEVLNERSLVAQHESCPKNQAHHRPPARPC